MGRASRYSPEVRERAVRMVFEHQREYDSQWRAMASIASKIGCRAETLRKWVRQAERDTGQRGGLTTDEKQRIDDGVHRRKSGPVWGRVDRCWDFDSSTSEDSTMSPENGRLCRPGNVDSQPLLALLHRIALPRGYATLTGMDPARTMKSYTIPASKCCNVVIISSTIPLAGVRHGHPLFLTKHHPESLLSMGSSPLGGEILSKGLPDAV